MPFSPPIPALVPPIRQAEGRELVTRTLAISPLDSEDLLRYCRVSDPAITNEVNMLYFAAVKAIEDITGRVILETTFRDTQFTGVFVLPGEFLETTLIRDAESNEVPGVPGFPDFATVTYGLNRVRAVIPGAVEVTYIAGRLEGELKLCVFALAKAMFENPESNSAARLINTPAFSVILNSARTYV